MEIILISGCVKVLDVAKATTSSEIFEIEFAKALSQLNKVSIISLAAVKSEKKANLSLFGIEKVSVINDVIESNNLFLGKSKIIIAYGYDFLFFKKLKKITNLYHAKLISYTFDTHKGAIEHRTICRKLLIDAYFQLGIKNLNNLDGIILFNKEAYIEMNLKIPYIVSKVGMDSNKISGREYKRSNQTFVIVYAGSLTKYNGIYEMIESMKYIKMENIELRIYGDGYLKDYVVKQSKHDERIHYFGLVTKEEIEKVFEHADLLLNLRNNNHIVSKFAFPSKLIQYLSSGVPVLTTNVIQDNYFKNVAFVIEGISPQEISGMIKYIIENPHEQQKCASLAKEYVKNNFQWNDIINEVCGFLNRI